MALTIHPKSTWGANDSNSTTPMGQPYGIGIHWNGPGLGVFKPDQYPGVIKGIERFHEVTRGWQDIAYNWFVTPHGVIYEGRGWGIRSAANGTTWGNLHFYAIYYLGGQGDPFTDPGKAAIHDLIHHLFGRGVGRDVRPHRGFKATACPGDDITRWVAEGYKRPGIAPTYPTTPPARIPVIQFSRGAVANPSGAGGWIVTAQGHVHAIGGAPFFGSLGGRIIYAPIVTLVPTPTGLGYWLIGAEGQVHPFGDAPAIKVYEPLFKEFAQMQRAIEGAFVTGVKEKRSTWGVTLISNHLEPYELKQ